MGERDDLLNALRQARRFLRHTVSGLSDEQAATRTTVSELCLGGLLKHVAAVEERWRCFIEDGAASFVPPADGDPLEVRAEQFRMVPGDTLAAILDHYSAVAAATDDLVGRLPSLDATQPLPPAPWFEPGAVWSARAVLLHVVAETAQHAGHADILREAIDGQKTMG